MRKEQRRFYYTLIRRGLGGLSIFILLYSCATQHPQYGKDAVKEVSSKDSIATEQSFYLVGNGSEWAKEENLQNYQQLKDQLNKADSSDYLLFLGDNVGLRNGSSFSQKKMMKVQEQLDYYLKLLADFKGKTIFVPGDRDWNNGLRGLQEQENYIKGSLNSALFLPKNGCGIEKFNISNSIGLIVLDSQWYLENWNNHPKINEQCDLKNKEDIFEEIESQLNNFQNKTTLVVMHHPLFSNGVHGGQFDFNQQLYPFTNSKIPLPFLGSFLNLIRSTSGLSPQDLQNYKYRNYASRIATLLENRNNVIVVSGHDRNLQFIRKGNVRQIISGSASRQQSAKAVGREDFSYGDKGFAKLAIQDKGVSTVEFFAFGENGVTSLLKKQVTDEKKIPSKQIYDRNLPLVTKASIYSTEMTDKSSAYKFFFGEHYRSIYSTEIESNVLNISNAFGGLKPLKMSIGHQTKNLRLTDSLEREYSLRSIRKSATQFIQQFAFKNTYMVNEFTNSLAERFLMDFYTTSHPYYPLAVDKLITPLSIYHVKPKLFYVPKQEALKEYNESIGNELYFLEEFPTTADHDGFFGEPLQVVTTDEMLVNIQKNNRVSVDKTAYRRARIVDMLIGDWDRSADHWRWGEYAEGKDTVYRPIPVNRSQAFPRYDGVVLKLLMGMPMFKHMQDFKGELKNMKWFNSRSYALDLAILQSSTLSDWERDVEFVQKSLTDDIIDNAFNSIPDASKSLNERLIIEQLKERRNQLYHAVQEYNKVLRRLVILKGTHEDDEIVVNRLSKGITIVKIYAGPEKKLILNETYSKKDTKEIRIYGLNGKDSFEVKGKGSSPILIRIVGGIDDDTYEIRRRKKIKIYDFKNGSNVKSSSFFMTKQFTNDNEVNTYQYTQPAYNVLSTLPIVGYNPDDGLKLGLSPVYTVNGFDRKPFSQKHHFYLNYFFSTTGIEAKYKGTLSKTFGKWNFEMNALYTSPSYSKNFFGFGNVTTNLEEEIGLNYNRVRMESYGVGPSFFRVFDNNTRIDVSTNYQYIKIIDNADRIVNEDNLDINRSVFSGQNFGDVGVKYVYKNYDNESLPTLGMSLLANIKWTSNLNEFERNFFYTELNLGFTHKLSANGRLTAASMLKGKGVWGNFIEFYQMANLGGDTDLRGYRLGRFTGHKVFLQSSDIRYDALKFTAIIPMRLGVFAGFDYGRVWYNGEKSNKWHNAWGGGIWLNGVQSITATVSYFKGEDPGRIVFGLNFGF